MPMPEILYAFSYVSFFFMHLSVFYEQGIILINHTNDIARICMTTKLFYTLPSNKNGSYK